MKTIPQRRYARVIYRSPFSVFLRRLVGCIIVVAALPFALAFAREMYGPAALLLLVATLAIFCVGFYLLLTARRKEEW